MILSASFFSLSRGNLHLLLIYPRGHSLAMMIDPALS